MVVGWRQVRLCKGGGKGGGCALIVQLAADLSVSGLLRAAGGSFGFLQCLYRPLVLFQWVPGFYSFGFESGAH